MGRFGNQRGETLIEVLLAIVLLGAISSAYFLMATTETHASSANRELVQADAVARSYAELAKAVVRNGCAPGSPLVVDTSTFAPGFTTSTPSSGPGAPICPNSSAPQQIDLTVTTPSGETTRLSFAVLAP